MNKAYFVYKHTTPNNKVYIGITSYSKPEQRWRNGKGYNNQYFSRAIKKYGWENIKHEILFSNLTKEQAEQKEIELIELNKSNNPIYGYNIENGGHVCCVSEITKEKLRGNRNAAGHKIDALKHQEMIKKSQTPEARAKLSRAKSKKIKCVETNTIYPNSLIAQEKTGIHFQNIRLVCLGKQKTAGGYHWEEIV